MAKREDPAEKPERQVKTIAYLGSSDGMTYMQVYSNAYRSYINAMEIRQKIGDDQFRKIVDSYKNLISAVMGRDDCCVFDAMTTCIEALEMEDARRPKQWEKTTLMLEAAMAMMISEREND